MEESNVQPVNSPVTVRPSFSAFYNQFVLPSPRLCMHHTCACSHTCIVHLSKHSYRRFLTIAFALAADTTRAAHAFTQAQQ